MATKFSETSEKGAHDVNMVRDIDINHEWFRLAEHIHEYYVL